MGWEDRGGRTYYYSKERRDGAVRSVYVPALCAQLTDLTVAERRIEVAAERDLIRLDRAAAARAVRACTLVRRAVERWLRDAGYHTHKRQWRRRRMVKQLGTGEPTTRAEVERLELLTQALMTSLAHKMPFAYKISRLPTK